MGIDTETFQLGAVAKAAGVPTQTVKVWVHTGRVTAQNVTGGRDEGTRRAFPFFAVMELATAKAVLDVAFQRDIDRAFAAAQAFAHTNSGYLGDVTSERCPGYPFAEGRTLLCITSVRARIINVRDGEDLSEIIRLRVGTPTAMVVVDMGAVFDRVVRALGFDPRDEMDAVYAGDDT